MPKNVAILKKVVETIYKSIKQLNGIDLSITLTLYRAVSFKNDGQKWFY